MTLYLAHLMWNPPKMGLRISSNLLYFFTIYFLKINYTLTLPETISETTFSTPGRWVSHLHKGFGLQGPGTKWPCLCIHQNMTTSWPGPLSFIQSDWFLVVSGIVVAFNIMCMYIQVWFSKKHTEHALVRVCFFWKVWSSSCVRNFGHVFFLHCFFGERRISVFQF